MRAFTPLNSATQKISATQTNTGIAFSVPGGAADCVRIYNAGPNTVFVNLTQGVAADAATDMPVAPTTVELFNKGLSTTFNAICATGETATVYVTPGEGI